MQLCLHVGRIFELALICYLNYIPSVPGLCL